MSTTAVNGAELTSLIKTRICYISDIYARISTNDDTCDRSWPGYFGHLIWYPR